MKRWSLVVCFVICAAVLTGCMEYKLSYELKESGVDTMTAHFVQYITDDSAFEPDAVAEADSLAKKYDVKFAVVDEVRDNGEHWLGYEFNGKISDMRRLSVGLAMEDLNSSVLDMGLEALEQFYGDVDEKGKNVLVFDLQPDSEETSTLIRKYAADENMEEVEYPDQKLAIRIKVDGKLIETNGVKLKDGTVEFVTTSSEALEYMYASWQVSDKFAENNKEFMGPKPTPPVDVSSEVGRFLDVRSDDWFAIPVWTMSKRGIITGFEDSTFRPGVAVSRADFLVMVMRAYDIAPNSNDTDNFADVARDKYYAPYLATAKRMGIADGMGYNEFWPTASVSRQDMCVMLYNILDVKEALPQGDNGRMIADFADGYKVKPYALDAVGLFVRAGVVSGMDGVLSPEGTSTRAQAAQVLFNLFE